MITENLPLSLGSSVVGKAVIFKKGWDTAQINGVEIGGVGVWLVIRMVCESI